MLIESTDAGIVYRFYDAGEPTGNAGKPIFQHLDGKDLVNCFLAVVQY
jgi:putative IMPACT (imprinted ancient) family translation regulator